MKETKENQKVFIDIVAKLREMIEVDNLVAGDKILSERELSERLQVGRSSVREALRALELLGLIETRRGEGTFITDFRDHQLVQLLSTFILQEKDARKDVTETKATLELESIRQTINKATSEELDELLTTIKSDDFNGDLFFEKTIRMSNNKLILKIWLILKQYYYSFSKEEQTNEQNYVKLYEAIVDRNVEQALDIYKRKIRNNNF